ncbi:MAG: hypothetical protein QOH17_3209 [Pseudonocardiales bacterium]|nr:hypothetical protein [Pseudonocardiales bacterium]
MGGGDFDEVGRAAGASRGDSRRAPCARGSSAATRVPLVHASTQPRRGDPRACATGSASFDGLRLTVRHAVTGDPVLEVRGRLNTSHTDRLADHLRGLLEEGDCVLIDLTNLQIDHPATLGVFTTVLASAGGWPTAKLSLICPDVLLRQALRAAGVSRRVPVAHSVELARLRAAQRPAHVEATWPLPEPRPPLAQVRSNVELRLYQWGFPVDAIADIGLIVNELVTNAVTHAEPPIRLSLLLTEDTLRCSVHDHSRLPPVMSSVNGGLGLQIIKCLTRDWGYRLHPDGKTIWANLHPPL